MHCYARAEWKSARPIFWARFSRRREPGRANTQTGPARQTIRLREEFHQQLDSREEILFGSRVMREPKFERPIEAVILGLALHQFQHAFGVDFVVFFENDVAARGSGVNFSDAEFRGAQFDLCAAEQG